MLTFSRIQNACNPPQARVPSPSEQLGTCNQLRSTHAVLFVFIIAAGLYVDQTFEIWGQIATSIAVWGVLLAFMHRTNGDLRLILTACLVWMTLGEVFASLIWGIYLYRLHNVPPFIPPGHVLMLLVAIYFAVRIPDWVVALAAAVAVGYSVYALGTGTDTMSVVLTPFFVVWLILSRSRKLYAMTFLLAIALELYGTWLGNWRWESRAPWLGWTMANPPLCIGALYCARDALVGITLNLIRRAQARSRPGPLANPFPNVTQPFAEPSMTSQDSASR